MSHEDYLHMRMSLNCESVEMHSDHILKTKTRPPGASAHTQLYVHSS